MPLQILRQDITKMKVDAIVNTTNHEMIGYSGVDFAIHNAAGRELDEYCKQIAPMKQGEVAVTDGYQLPCKYIIHTCGPIWKGGNQQEKEHLENCYISCLLAALEHDCETIAFPLISSGVYGYPKDQVLALAVNIISKFLLDHELMVYLCVFDRTSYEVSQKLMQEVHAYIDDHYVQASQEAEDNWMDEKAESIQSDECCCYCVAPNTLPKEEILEFSISQDLNFWIQNMDKSFAETLFSLIDEKGMTDVECYTKANVSRKTFSKIRCNPNYLPSKATAVSFAIALELNLEETHSFLRTAGITLSQSFLFDVIIMFFISKGDYNIATINTCLFEHDQVCLGC